MHSSVSPEDAFRGFLEMHLFESFAGFLGPGALGGPQNGLPLPSGLGHEWPPDRRSLLLSFLVCHNRGVGFKHCGITSSASCHGAPPPRWARCCECRMTVWARRCKQTCRSCRRKCKGLGLGLGLVVKLARKRLLPPAKRKGRKRTSQRRHRGEGENDNDDDRKRR